MKKKILSLAVAAGLSGVMAGAAHAAMHINDKGMGEALVYPFYSVEGGNDTYIHVTNTTDHVKAVKVRFIEAENSREVLDFNLYLSPHDVWAGAITVTADGGGAIRTVDTSCTVPDLGQTTGNGHVGSKTELPNGLVLREQRFVDFEYAGAYGLDPTWQPGEGETEEDRPLRTTSDSNKSITRTAQGYVEIIEMGQLDLNASTLLAPIHRQLARSVVHNADGIPVGRVDAGGSISAMNPCADLVAAWAISPTPGVWTNIVGTSGGQHNEDNVTGRPGALGSQQDRFLPWDENAGGLWGYGVVLNVEQGTAVGYDAIAIDSFFDVDDADVVSGSQNRNLHYAPGSLNPSLNHGTYTASIFNNGQAGEYTFTEREDAVSALFMSSNISNDFVTDPDINAATDWVVTMPTKRFYTNGLVRAPFTKPWNGAQACETVAMEHWDREEAHAVIVADAGFSPRPPQAIVPGFALCTEVSIVQFGDYSPLNGSERITYGYDTGSYVDGWARMSFDGDARRVLESVDGDAFIGLPVVGFAAIAYQNGTLAGGVLSNYTAGVTHKSEQVID